MLAVVLLCRTGIGFIRFNIPVTNNCWSEWQKNNNIKTKNKNGPWELINQHKESTRRIVFILAIDERAPLSNTIYRSLQANMSRRICCNTLLLKLGSLNKMADILQTMENSYAFCWNNMFILDLRFVTKCPNNKSSIQVGRWLGTEQV